MSLKGEVGVAINGDIAGQGFVAGFGIGGGEAAGVDAIEVEGGGFGVLEGEDGAAGICVGRVGDAVVGFGVGRDAAEVGARALVLDGYVIEVEVAVFAQDLGIRAVIELGWG